MNISVYQCISVHNLSIGNVTNSSVLQIGTSGKINALSHNHQPPTDGAPPISPITTTDISETPKTPDTPIVPLPPATELYTHLN